MPPSANTSPRPVSPSRPRAARTGGGDSGRPPASYRGSTGPPRTREGARVTDFLANPGLGGPVPVGGFGADESPRASYTLRVNGVERPVAEAWIGESLLYVLRERLGLAGAKGGCDQGECGACSVQLDGQLTAACLVPAALAADSDIRTVEGLADDGTASDVQRALAESGAVQCGYCVPGLAMAVHDLLERNHQPAELETREALSGNLCRCTGYRGALAAVQAVARARAEQAESDAEQGESTALIPEQQTQTPPQATGPAPVPPPGQSPGHPQQGHLQQGHPQPGYPEPPYTGQGFQGQGLPEPPFPGPAFPEQAHAEPAYTEQPHAAQPFAEQGFPEQSHTGQSHTGQFATGQFDTGQFHTGQAFAEQSFGDQSFGDQAFAEPPQYIGLPQQPGPPDQPQHQPQPQPQPQYEYQSTTGVYPDSGGYGTDAGGYLPHQQTPAAPEAGA
ncbi:2Fe-2S iron-sulfur cluster binding domain-containing protein [Streptacidiphilus sp. 4-A2]|nr:2Fe-2S iron-sulfur cluster binding domain-containing protein [Streptacidiphilus sp. 4-A2]